MSNDACETPLLDLLNSVPADARMIYEHSPTHSSNIPVGVLVKRAADALTAQARELEALRADAEELKFLEEDLLYWVDRAVSKGNANCDIEEAFGRYETWLNDRHAAMQSEKAVTT